MESIQIENTLIENSIAISKLTEIATRTSKDVDKIIVHIDNIIPMVTKLTELEHRIDKLEAHRNKIIWTLVSVVITIIGGLLMNLIGGV